MKIKRKSVIDDDFYKIKLLDSTNEVKDKPKLVGGIGEINYGKQFRQGNRVYSADHIAMCLTAQPLGNIGGYSYLYLV